MSSITEEQKARMEENRRKAMEIRAAKLKQQTSSQSFPPSAQIVHQSNKRPFPASSETNFSKKTLPMASPGATVQKFYSNQSRKKVGPELRGDLTLISEDRFELIMGYHNTTIEALKKIQGREYGKTLSSER